MPYIDSKITVKLSDSKKEEIKSAMGKLIATLGKSEDYLMVGIEDSYDLWFGGRKLEKARMSPSAFSATPRKKNMKSLPGRSAI